MLADKLGTTVDHIWSVLLKQAPVSAFIDISGWILLIVLLSIVLFKLFRVNVDVSKTFDEVGKTIAILVTSLVLFIVLMCGLLSLSNDISGFTNPEYWALNKLLSYRK